MTKFHFRFKAVFLALPLALVIASCGAMGAEGILNPAASGFNENFGFSANGATDTDDLDFEEQETVILPDGSVVVFDQNGDIIHSDTATASLGADESPSSPSGWDDNTYAYVPDTNGDEIPWSGDENSDFLGGDDNNNDFDSSDSSNNSDSSNAPANFVDVNDQDNFDNNVDLNGDPLDELAHLPVTVAKNNQIPSLPNEDSGDPDEEEDCGDNNDGNILIETPSDEGGSDEFEGPDGFGGSGSGGNSSGNGNYMTLETTDCGDEEAEEMAGGTESASPWQRMRDGTLELMIVETTQNPDTGKWELLDDYVIVAAEPVDHSQSTGKTKRNFKIDKILLNNHPTTQLAQESGSDTPPRTKTHFILQHRK